MTDPKCFNRSRTYHNELEEIFQSILNGESLMSVPLSESGLLKGTDDFEKINRKNHITELPKDLQDMIGNFIKEKHIFSPMKVHDSLIRQMDNIIRSNPMMTIIQFVKIMVDMGIMEIKPMGYQPICFFTAEQAAGLIETRASICNDELWIWIHQVCCLVGDTWNISVKKFGDKDNFLKGTIAECYYGNVSFPKFPEFNGWWIGQYNIEKCRAIMVDRTMGNSQFAIMQLKYAKNP